jgi:hypothetical protein
MFILFNSLRGAYGLNTRPADFIHFPGYGNSQGFEPNSTKGMSEGQKIEVLQKIFVPDLI